MNVDLRPARTCLFLPEWFRSGGRYGRVVEVRL